MPTKSIAGCVGPLGPLGATPTSRSAAAPLLLTARITPRAPGADAGRAAALLCWIGSDRILCWRLRCCALLGRPSDPIRSDLLLGRPPLPPPLEVRSAAPAPPIAAALARALRLSRRATDTPTAGAAWAVASAKWPVAGARHGASRAVSAAVGGGRTLAKNCVSFTEPPDGSARAPRRPPDGRATGAARWRGAPPCSRAALGAALALAAQSAALGAARLAALPASGAAAAGGVAVGGWLCCGDG